MVSQYLTTFCLHFSSLLPHIGLSSKISYMMFLYIYAVSVMKPFCGDPFLNKIVAAWLLVLFIEEILNSATKRIVRKTTRSETGEE